MPRSYRPATGPGVPNPNRTDLNNAAMQGVPSGGNQPVRVAPGGPQGSRQQLEAAQSSVPLPDSEAQMQGAVQQATGYNMPPQFDRPSENPNEPITTGLPLGPGSGPGVNAQTFDPMQQQDLQQLARYLPQLELLASSPQASIETRNLIRRIRGAQAPGLRYEDMFNGMA